MPVCLYRVCLFITVLYLSLSLAGCATTAVTHPTDIPPMHSMKEFSDDEQVIGIADPWERFNRRMYKFNYNVDKYFLLPVVGAYDFVTPTFVQKGVTNFFGNLGEVRTLYNSLFQLKGKKFLTTFGRFFTNSTIGMGGLFDPATHIGMKKQNEDFGRTLGYWGVNSGPYLVLPLLGPSNVRSTGGLVVDGCILYAIGSAVDPLKNVNGKTAITAGLSALQGINMRHNVKFRYYESGFPFEYNMVRFLHHKMGELSLIK